MSRSSVDERGALLVELLVAVAILSVVAVSIGMTLGGANRMEVGNQAKNRLSAVAESMVERLRSDTDWMRSNACTGTVHTDQTCDLAWMFDGTGPAGGPYSAKHPGLDHADYGAMRISATAQAVDAADDGEGDDDKDKQVVDLYRIAVSIEYEDAERLSPGLKPVRLETTISTRMATGTGALSLQVCRIRHQVDERIAVTRCDVARQERIAPAARYNAATGGTTADDQAYTCAHPDHYRATSPLPFVNAAESAAVTMTKCYSADGPYAASTTPSYEKGTEFFGTWRWDPFPDFAPAAGNLPAADPYRYVSSRIEPVPSVGVTITGAADSTAAGTSVSGTTNAQGVIRWADLAPGRYTMTIATGLPTGTRLSREISVPGDSVTVSQGVESRATQVLVPRADKTIRVSLRTVDTSYPWGLPVGWRAVGGNVSTSADQPPYVLGAWKAAWGTQGAGAGATYKAQNGTNFTWDAAWGPAPVPTLRQKSTWYVKNPDGTPQNFCVEVQAIPPGRLVNGGQKVCRHQPETTHYTFTDLAPGLYSFEVLGTPAFVWRRENYPGFIWVNEDGSTVPSSSTTDWSVRARASYYGCTGPRRDVARFLFDANLPPSPCGASVGSDDGDDGSGGGGG